MAKRSHGMTRLPDGRRGPTYTVWQLMKRRCLNPKVAHFVRYGGRGIRDCARWRDSFENFLADMGERPDGATLDRKNNDGNYTPSNCRWVARKANSRNRSDSRLLTLNGQTKTLAEWVEVTGHSLATLQGRVRMGWTDKQVLTTPPRARESNHVLTIGGVSKPLSDWCKDRDISPRTVRHRLSKQGMTPAEALGL
jgi:hypothetical protein